MFCSSGFLNYFNSLPQRNYVIVYIILFFNTKVFAFLDYLLFVLYIVKSSIWKIYILFTFYNPILLHLFYTINLFNYLFVHHFIIYLSFYTLLSSKHLSYLIICYSISSCCNGHNRVAVEDRNSTEHLFTHCGKKCIIWPQNTTHNIQEKC